MLQIMRVLRTNQQQFDPKRTKNHHILRKRSQDLQPRRGGRNATNSRLDGLTTYIGIALVPGQVLAPHRQMGGAPRGLN
jgi:hypothetical protein